MALSNRTTVLLRLAEGLAVRASSGQGFRPPTLYERYATGRVRDDVVAGTPRLDAERTMTGELGVEYRAPEALTLRATAFWNEVTDAIGAVAVPPELVPTECATAATCRRRLNLDRVRVLGTEIEAEYALPPGWRLRAGYLVQESHVVRASMAPAIEGNRLARVPRSQLTLGAQYRRAGWPTIAGRLRYVGPQFEDAENRLRLGSAWVVDVSISAPLGRSGEVFLGVENLLDQASDLERTGDGVVTTGGPRAIRGGLRFRF